MNKDQAREKVCSSRNLFLYEYKLNVLGLQFGDEQVHIWRRSFDIPPPEGESLEVCRFIVRPALANNANHTFSNIQLTAKRTLPYFKEKILPQILAGKNVLVRMLHQLVLGMALSLTLSVPRDRSLPTATPTDPSSWTLRSSLLMRLSTLSSLLVSPSSSSLMVRHAVLKIGLAPQDH